MKKVFLLLLCMAIHYLVLAQSPQKMSYQAVIRDHNDQLLVNTQVGIRVSVQKYIFGLPPTYQNVYVETHLANTNANGLVSIQVGNGTLVSGVFSEISWGDGQYYIKTDTDPAGGTNYTITGRTELLSVPYALYAKETKTYKVGDFAHGGIVFWVDETGLHGLVCAKNDQSTGVRWYAGTHGDTQAKGDGPYAGKMNTILIIATQVALGDDGMAYAARYCSELKITEGGVSYGDWYLPSKEELNLMYINKTEIDITAAANGGTALGNVWYWTSNQNGNEHAWYQNLSNGYQSDSNKNTPNRVRAIRAF
jgi:hypothetical protein